MTTTYLEPGRLTRAKAAYTTRRVPQEALATVLGGDLSPRSGDLVLARVIELGQHDRIERHHGRQATLFPGEEVVVCYGHRYAPDQFEAEVPADLGHCNLVASGGIASRALSWHEAILKPPSVLEPIGLLGDRDGQRVNLADWALKPVPGTVRRPLVLAVVGTSMNSGKTTTAAYLIRGFVSSGLAVGAAKITGTGAGKDPWMMTDAGANPVFDFTDAGFPSTYLADPDAVRGIATTLTGHIAAIGVDAIVLEIADGLYQRETVALLSSPQFTENLDGLIFAAGEAMGAAAGVEWLRRHGLPVLGVAGSLTRSPLAIREAREATGLPVFPIETLSDAAIGGVLGPAAVAT
ncbi:MAG: DUF1611 domain-containing protein [Chloroflexota bacterium]|nr:DUF1611 domain-containing protein [Chloroflexota bacterium]